MILPRPLQQIRCDTGHSLPYNDSSEPPPFQTYVFSISSTTPSNPDQTPAEATTSKHLTHYLLHFNVLSLTSSAYTHFTSGTLILPASSKQPATNSQQPAASNQQQATSSSSSQQPAASGQQPAASSQQPAASTSTTQRLPSTAEHFQRQQPANTSPPPATPYAPQTLSPPPPRIPAPFFRHSFGLSQQHRPTLHQQASSIQQPASSKQPPASSQQPAASNQQHATSSSNSQHPASSSQQPAASRQQPAASEKLQRQITSSSQQPRASNPQHILANKQPAASSQQRAASSQPSTSTSKQPVASSHLVHMSLHPPPTHYRTQHRHHTASLHAQHCAPGNLSDPLSLLCLSHQLELFFSIFFRTIKARAKDLSRMKGLRTLLILRSATGHPD